jgi:hypothetical protein
MVLAFLMLMGIAQKPTSQLYFLKKKYYFGNSCVISIDLFELICKFSSTIMTTKRNIVALQNFSKYTQ